AQNVWELFILRALMGFVSGFISASGALQATQTPKEYAGRALGTLQAGAVAGNLIGPLVGGVLADSIGIRQVFFLTGFLQMIAGIVVIIFVKEKFTPDIHTSQISSGEFLRKMAATRIVIPLFFVTFLTQVAYLTIEPIVTIYVRELAPQSHHITILAGAAFAAIGLGTMLSAPRLGKLGDRWKAENVLLLSLIVAAVLYLPQAFVHAVWELIALRFVLGLAVGGLRSPTQSLIRQFTPSALQGRAFGFNSSFLFAGNLVGPLLGGLISSIWGIRSIFFITSAILLLNTLWMYFSVIRRPVVPQES
ncbi:MAG: MFS transporter, partial [Firmicutes bacterium]|nr:MFS transporter [Bacillota bacterium]